MIGGINGWFNNESHGIDTVYNTTSSPTTFSRIESHFDGANGRIRFRNLYNNSAPRTDILMTIQGNGNVGIGTDSPAAKLHTSTTTAGNSVGILLANPNQSGTADSVSINFGLGRTSDSFLRSDAAITFGKEQQWTGTPSTVDGYLAFSTTLNEVSAEKMRITSGGNVLIGTTTDGANSRLTVNSNGDGNSVALVGRSLDNKSSLDFVSSNFSTFMATIDVDFSSFDFGSQIDIPLRFYTNTAERMRIFSGGNVRIGASSVTDSGDVLRVGGTTFTDTIITQTPAATKFLAI
jgi:hypothetical protein